MAIVYQHRNAKTNHFFYVGIGQNEKRAFAKTGRSEDWFKVTLFDGYTVEITHKELVYEEAQSIEKYLISFWREYNGKDSLKNLTDGGKGTAGFIQTDEAKQRAKKGQAIAFARPETKEKHRKNAYKCFNDENGIRLNAKKVINTVTGEIFDTCKIAALSNGYNYPQFRANLNGQTKTNHTHFVYLENYNK